MDFSGCHFEYSGVSSREFGLIFANANTSRFISLMGVTESNYVFNKRNNKRYFIGENFENSPIQFDAEVTTDDDRILSKQERRVIEQWLFRKPGYNKLYMDMTDDTLSESFETVSGVTKRLYLMCRFSNPEKLEDGTGIRGYKFTVECDSCMAWQEPIIASYQLEHDSETSNSVIVVNVDTDIQDYTYPQITIDAGSTGGKIIISNNTDDASRLTSFVDVPVSSQIIMNGCVNYISGQNFERFSDRNFVRLLNGDNYISVIGDVSNITFEWNNRRYL